MSDKIRVAVSGSHGFIGKRLCQSLQNEGFEVWPLVRHKTNIANEIFYDFHDKKIEEEKLAKCSAVIHLAGQNIMGGFWTTKFKKELYDSRVKSTLFLSHKLAQMNARPKLLLNASATGIYGDRSDQKLDEESLPGQGFLADLCVDWERSTLFAKKANLRVVNMRFGMVIDPSRGFLKSLSSMFRIGFGTLLGKGENYLSYVFLDELIKQIIFVINHDQISGPVNFVSLEPVTQKEFINAIGQVLHKPILCHVPAFFIKILGKPAKLALSSSRVYPKALLDAHFPFNDQPLAEKLHELMATRQA